VVVDVLREVDLQPEVDLALNNFRWAPKLNLLLDLLEEMYPKMRPRSFIEPTEREITYI
jgi:hypothetical protein